MIVVVVAAFLAGVVCGGLASIIYTIKHWEKLAEHQWN